MYLVFLNFPTQPQIQLKQFAAFLKEMLLLSTERYYYHPLSNHFSCMIIARYF